MSEKQLEKWCKQTAENLGFLVYKFKSPANRGVPDDLMINLEGETFYVEFKNPNGKGKVSKLQAIVHKKMRAAGARVYVVESKEEFLEVLYQETTFEK